VNPEAMISGSEKPFQPSVMNVEVWAIEARVSKNKIFSIAKIPFRGESFSFSAVHLKSF
jgi:hypothetical protein